MYRFNHSALARSVAAASLLAVACEVQGVGTTRFAAGPCSADLNYSGQVNALDLGILLGNWGMRGAADLDGSGLVDAGDLAILFGQWGPCPESGLECTPQDVIPLEDDGTFTMPSWADASEAAPFLIDLDVFGGSVEIFQDPAAGTITFGEGAFAATATIVGANGHSEICETSILIVDHTPPNVVISGVSDGAALDPGTVVIPTVQATDSVSPSGALLVELLLDGDAIALGTPITEPGLYTLVARATDSAGNIGESGAVTFEIMKVPYRSGVAVVESMEPCVQRGEFVDLDVTLLVGASASECVVADIDLYSIALWPLNANDFPLSRQVVYIDETTSADGYYVYPNSLNAEYVDGYWRLHFRASVRDESVIGCPVSFLVTGSGRIGERNEFDFSAETPAYVHADPANFMQLAGAVNKVAAPLAPPVQPCPKCKWKQWLKADKQGIDEVDTDKDTSCIAASQWAILEMWARNGRFWGFGKAKDGCLGAANDSNSVTNKAHWWVWLEGRKECCKPTVTVIMQPSFKASVEIDPPAQTYALGGISVATTCQNKTAIAKGGAEASDLPATEISMGASAGVGKDGPQAGAEVSIKTTLTAGANSVDLPFSANVIATCNSNEVVVALVGFGAIKVKANTTPPFGHSWSRAWLYKATRGIEITAKCAADSQCGPVKFEDDLN